MPTKNTLSEREREVLRLLATGATNKEIATRLVISPNTVKVHLRNIYAKIEVGSRTEASMWALQHGLLEVSLPAERQPSEAASPETPREEPSPSPAAAPRRLRGGLVAFMLLLALVGGGLLGRALLAPRSAPVRSSQVVAGAELTRWKQQPALPVARWGMIPVTYANALYLFGGQDERGDFQDGYVLRVNRTQWERLPPAPQPIAGGCAALLGEKIYLAGGLLPSGEAHSQLQVFDPRQGTWEMAAPLPLAVSGCALTAYEGRLYLFGGRDGKAYLDAALRYDPQDDRWSQLPPLATPRAGASAVVTTSGIHLLGGYDAGGALTSHALFLPYRQTDPQASWRSLADVPAAGAQIRATALADLLHVFVLDDAFTRGWVFNANENTWQPVESPPQPLGLDVAVTPAETFIHFLGGRQGTQPSSAHWAYQAIFVTAIPVIIQ